MRRYTIREVQEPDFSGFFDDEFFTDGFNINNCVFVFGNYNKCLFNKGIINDIISDINYMIDSVEYDLGDDPQYNYHTIEGIFKDFLLPYSEENERKFLRIPLEETSQLEGIRLYLEIKTGDSWKIQTVRGYCQSEWIDIVYNESVHTNKAINIFGDLFLGCGKEFSITDTEKDETVYGYFVADCQAFNPSDYKRIVCEYENILEDEATLELIDSRQTVEQVTYKEY